MTDDGLNKKLAEVMGRDDCELERFSEDVTYIDKDGWRRVFTYKDPAIFAENVKWLLDNGAIIGTDSDDKYFVDHSTFSGQRETFDKDIYKAVALARIEVSKHE